MPLPVLRSSRTLEQYLASARIVENTVPVTRGDGGNGAADRAGDRRPLSSRSRSATGAPQP